MAMLAHDGHCVQQTAILRRRLDVQQIDKPEQQAAMSGVNWPEQGLGGTRLGAEILAEELVAAGQVLPELDVALSAGQEALRDAWIARLGDWPRHAEVLLRLDPGYFALVLELSSYADPADRLAEMDRVLI